MSFFSSIWDAIKRLFSAVGRLIKRIVVSILNFAKHVVNWFKLLNLNPTKQTPFVIDAKHLSSMIAKAPRVNCGIFAGVYDNETETITECEIIEADELDSKTKSVLGNADEDGMVVLS